MPQGIGERVKTVRTNHGWSQAQLARRLDVATEASVYRLEAGRSLPSLPLLLRLTAVLAVSIDYLLGLVDASTPVSQPPSRAYAKHDVSERAFASIDVAQVFGTNLRRLRLQRGWSQSELARRLDVGAAHVNRIEAGAKPPSLRLIIAVAQLFDASADALLDLSTSDDETSMGHASGGK